MSPTYRASNCETVRVDAYPESGGANNFLAQSQNTKFETERAAKDAEIATLRAELADLRSLKEEVASIRAAQSSR